MNVSFLSRAPVLCSLRSRAISAIGRRAPHSSPEIAQKANAAKKQNENLLSSLFVSFISLNVGLNLMADSSRKRNGELK